MVRKPRVYRAARQLSSHYHAQWQAAKKQFQQIYQLQAIHKLLLQ